MRSTTQNYSFVDASFVESSYYRLSQEDNNGQQTIYNDKVRYVKGYQQDIKLYPNPTTTKAFLKLPFVPKNGLVKLLDINGNLLSTCTATADTPLEISVADLPPGAFIVQWEDATGKQSRKLIKQ